MTERIPEDNKYFEEPYEEEKDQDYEDSYDQNEEEEAEYLQNIIDEILFDFFPDARSEDLNDQIDCLSWGDD